MSDRDPGDWARYYERLQDRPPRTTTVFAARRFDAPGLVVDLGCGAGRDCLPLLRAGWRVVAIDREASAIERLRAAAPSDRSGELETRQESFETADLPAADLIISCFALPLTPKPAFPGLWRRIIASLKPGGRFAGQLYGVRDSWARNGTADGVVAFDRAGCLELLSDLKVEFFEEEEHDGVTPRGKSKHWHIFHIVAAKR